MRNSKNLLVLIMVVVTILSGCSGDSRSGRRGAATSGGGSSEATYAIGDTGPAGGLIFYIDEAGEYDWTYLEVASAST